MKHSNQNLPLAKEYNRKETTTVLETVCFTDINEKDIKSKSPLTYSELLAFIAGENKLKCMFLPCGMVGDLNDIKKAQDIFINMLKHN